MPWHAPGEPVVIHPRCVSLVGVQLRESCRAGRDATDFAGASVRRKRGPSVSIPRHNHIVSRCQPVPSLTYAITGLRETLSAPSQRGSLKSGL